MTSPGVGRGAAGFDPRPHLVGEPAGLTGAGERFEDLPGPAAAVEGSGRDEQEPGEFLPGQQAGRCGL
ncbi:hypothetical protein R5W24_005130 [Gemmata sp. JC717]|uniref:hypothetical protein n=1 Tax=Gemmata algarum TaxID=2975278 RepID=UPI0021BAEB46|nr:hypothetical protein [Gemmata algarum]MDY3555983.1 hypothetical protein [Gemmata algarum]